MKQERFVLVDGGETGTRRSNYSCMNILSNITNVSDCAFPAFPRALFAEFLGSAILVIFGCGSALTVNEDLHPSVVSIALAFGLTVATVIWSLGHVSGAQINPCVAVSMWMTRKMTFVKTLSYCIVQCGGAIVGGYVLYALTPNSRRGNLAVTLVSPEIDVWQAVGVEILATFVLVMAIFATCDSRIDDHPGSKALSIGLVVTMDIPWAAQYTGASMNSARSLGPAVVMGIWDDHWVYWLGPMLGGIAAGLIYEHVFAVNASALKTKEWLGSRDYNEARIYQRIQSRRNLDLTKTGERELLRLDKECLEEEPNHNIWQAAL